jgi:hypothetical protein
VIFGPFGFAVPGRDYHADAAQLTVDDQLSRGGALTGVASGKKGIFSAWLNPSAAVVLAGGLNGVGRLFSGGVTCVFFWREDGTGTGKYTFTVDLRDSGEVQKIGMETAAITPGNWTHFLASWDTDANARHLYVNDVSNAVVTTFVSASTIAYASALNWTLGDSSEQEVGPVGDLYFNSAEYLDISNVTHRRKFIDEYRRPVNLGSDGSTPTGTAPIVHLHLDDGQAAANFATNRGSGGNFTVSTGTLTTAAISHTDG